MRRRARASGALHVGGLLHCAQMQRLVGSDCKDVGVLLCVAGHDGFGDIQMGLDRATRARKVPWTTRSVAVLAHCEAECATMRGDTSLLRSC